MMKEGPIRVVGAMSGTSLDGIDAAEIVTDGHRIFEMGNSSYRAYTPPQRAVLQKVLGCWPEDDVAEAAELIETVHAQVFQGYPEAELIGFHGQTLAHDPQGRGTHQLGDGAVIAEVLGKPVVWDFRSADIQMGGEGAPLAPFFHFALARMMEATAPLAMLNLGGVGNLTWIDPRLPHPESDGALLAFDTGPANAPINDLMQARLGQPYDNAGALAATGTADEAILAEFLRHPYFFRMPPKSLDRDAFAALQAAVAPLADADAAATLTQACALAVAEGVKSCPAAPEAFYVMGGGRLNETLMDMLDDLLPCAVQPIEDAGFDGSLIEAQAFAYLAVRVARGLPTSAPGTTGVAAPLGSGTLSRPS